MGNKIKNFIGGIAVSAMLAGSPGVKAQQSSSIDSATRAQIERIIEEKAQSIGANKNNSIYKTIEHGVWDIVGECQREGCPPDSIISHAKQYVLVQGQTNTGPTKIVSTGVQIKSKAGKVSDISATEQTTSSYSKVAKDPNRNHGIIKQPAAPVERMVEKSPKPDDSADYEDEIEYTDQHGNIYRLGDDYDQSKLWHIKPRKLDTKRLVTFADGAYKDLNKQRQISDVIDAKMQEYARKVRLTDTEDRGNFYWNELRKLALEVIDECIHDENCEYSDNEMLDQIKKRVQIRVELHPAGHAVNTWKYDMNWYQKQKNMEQISRLKPGISLNKKNKALEIMEQKNCSAQEALRIIKTGYNKKADKKTGERGI